MHPVLEMFTILDVKFEGRRLAKIQLRTKQLVCLFLMLTSMVLSFSFLPRAKAGMVLFAVTPDTGNVGTNVTLTANLTTTNGRYNITFDNVVEAFGNATGNDVTVSFLVPETTVGSHDVAVVDVNTGENATGYFVVLSSYSLNVSVPAPPAQLQENDSVPISVNVTGGIYNSTVDAEITVQTPNGTSYVQDLGISTSTVGSGNATLVYPGNFSGGANTDYVGDYEVSFDLSNATMPFFVGLTNSTEYHRMETINVKAVYAQNETVTLTVSGLGISPVNVTADSAGLINYSSWTVPNTASIGNYTVNIVSASGHTVKTPQDTQNFTVPGFAFNVTARNLAGDLVPNVDVRAFEHEVSVINRTTNSNGLAVLTLELGNFTLQGYFQGVKVGEREVEVTYNETSNFLDFMVNLTNLNIRVVSVVNGAEIGIPEVGVYLTPGGVGLKTDITGSVMAHSLLPNATYVLNASRYNIPFPNVTTIASLLGVDGNPVNVSYVNITCPSFTLKVNAFKADGQPFSNAVVEAKELLGGIHYHGNTDSNGTVAFSAIFGKYNVEIHDSAGKQLNSTATDLFQDQNVTVYCNLFDLSISVTVTDYFGQPFPNINITLQGNGSEPILSRTQANGMVTFDNLIGDSFSISVYLSEQGPPTVVDSLLVDGSTAVPIRINKYVLLAGFVVETSQLAIAVIIVLSLVLVLSLEVYRKRRNKSKKIDS